MIGDLASSLGAPGQAPTTPVNLPDAGLPSADAFNTSTPNVNPPQATPSQPDKLHLAGRAVGSIFRGLSGTQEDYKVDPNTGKTITTVSKAPPGQWARGILAAGLLGANNIDEEHGQKTFAQGLLSGLTGGTRASMQLREQDDEKKKAQAQQDYANQLKAQENSRQDKELSLRETLNAAQVAKENIETAVQNQIFHEHLQNEEGMAGKLLIDGDKNTVSDYQDAGEKPYLENLTAQQLDDLMKSEPGAIKKYKGVATGQKIVKGSDGQNHFETTYSVYLPLTTVPESLLARMRAVDIDKSAPAMYNELNDAYKNGTTVDYRKISHAQQQARDEAPIQEQLDKHREAVSAISAHNSEAAAAAIRAKRDEFGYQNDVEEKTGSDLYNSRFNPLTGEVNLQGLQDTKDSKGKTIVNKDRIALVGYLNKMSQYYSSELLKYEKRNADGSYTIDDPAGQGIQQSLNSVKRGLDSLAGKITTSPPGSQKTTVDSLDTLRSRVISDAPSHLSNAITYFTSDVQTKGPDGKQVTIPAATSLAEALDRLDANQNTPDARLSPQDYKDVANALTEYYQNAGPVQQKIASNQAQENTQNRYVRLHALNPEITFQNQYQYNNDGTPASSHVSGGGLKNTLTSVAPS